VSDETILPDREYPGFWADQEPDRLAIVVHGSDKSMTFQELHDEAARIANLFRSLGLSPEDHVAFCLENRIEFLPLAWGAIYAGLTYTAISSRLTTDEVAYIVNDCGARVFITSPYKAEAAAEIISETPNVEARFSIGGELLGHAPFEDAVATQGAEVPEDAVEGQDMLYSSGTTGRPKGVKRAPTGALLGMGDTIAAMVKLLFKGEPGGVYLSPAPLYHAAPLRFCLAF